MMLIAAGAAVLFGTAAPAQIREQAWPQSPVKVIVPFAAGGPSDSMARITAQRLSEALGQPFVIENLPGAGGAIAGQTVVRARGDGYTLYWVTPAQVTILPLITKLSYDPVKSLLPITAVAEVRFVLVANTTTLPVRSVSEFVDYVRARPGKLSFAHAGPGSITQLAMELFLHRASLQMVGVAYKGIAPGLADVIAGHVPTMFASVADAEQQRKAGALGLLGVSTRKRSPKLPDVPTVNESGVPGYNIASWNGLMAPPGTPRAIVERISGEIGRATNTPEFSQRLANLGFDPVGSSSEEFAAVIAAEIPMWMEAVNGAQLKRD
jgi:tripartite-type tricarboxylate transporter receptor subunit TctC